MNVTAASILETIEKVKTYGGSPRFIYVRRDFMPYLEAQLRSVVTEHVEPDATDPRMPNYGAPPTPLGYSLRGIPLIPVDYLPYPYWVTDIDLREKP